MIQDIRICFIGDSFVNGSGDEAALGWAGRLCAAANTRDRAITYYNLGIRRDTSKDILLRWENECIPRLPEDCGSRIVLSCGVNDTVIENGVQRVEKAASCENVRKILSAENQYKLLMVGPPPIDDDEQNERIKHLSEAFAELAGELKIPYIKLYSALVNDEAYKTEIRNNDGAHPRSDGYSKMAKIISASANWWF